MTEPRPDSAAPPPRARRPARSQRPAAVAYGGAAVTFVAMLAGLSWQLAAGGDPAIGEGRQAAAPAPAEQVVVRRIVRRVVVTDAAPAAVAAAPSAPSAPSAPAPAAPAASAPVAPAPPTTRSS
ncbi:MAG TPA: hypothetical protein VK631_03030 [Solirubrobacteraceae bacterium]|nr:hypothetical protein [Solirubrobacteraceae bacterium]